MASWKHLVAGSRGVPAVRFRPATANPPAADCAILARSPRRLARPFRARAFSRSRTRTEGYSRLSVINSPGLFAAEVIYALYQLVTSPYSRIVANALLITVATPYVLHMITVKRRNVMIPDELTIAARNLAHSLGIPVYIRDGRIYQHGPGIEFLPPKDPAASIAEDLSTIVDEDGF